MPTQFLFMDFTTDILKLLKIIRKDLLKGWFPKRKLFLRCISTYERVGSLIPHSLSVERQINHRVIEGHRVIQRRSGEFRIILAYQKNKVWYVLGKENLHLFRL